MWHDTNEDGGARGGRDRGFRGAHLNPPGLILRTFTQFIWRILSAFLPACAPMAEGARFPQALSDDRISSYYAEGCMEGCMGGRIIRYFPPVPPQATTCSRPRSSSAFTSGSASTPWSAAAAGVGNGH
jgi:hypothetical protein